MKQKITLGSSIPVLIAVVIAILSLIRGPAQTILLLITFAAWVLWMILAVLRPTWRANSELRRREQQAERDQGLFSGRNVAQLLVCHVNSRVTDHLRSVYPDVRWEWMMNDPALFIVQGGTGRIRIFGVPDYEFADVTLDRKGGLSCSMVKVVPVQNSTQGTSSGQHSVDPQVWYEVEGRDVMEQLIADLTSRGHSSLTVNEDGSVSIQTQPGTDTPTRHRFPTLPAKVYWPQLADVLEQEGLTPDVQADRIVVSW